MNIRRASIFTVACMMFLFLTFIHPETDTMKAVAEAFGCSGAFIMGFVCGGTREERRNKYGKKI